MSKPLDLELLIAKAQHEIQSTEPSLLYRNRLLRYVQRSPKLLRSSHPDYLDALDRTYEWLLRHLGDFHGNPDEEMEITFFRWVNGHLKWRIKDLQNNAGNPTYSLDQVIDRSDAESETYLDQLTLQSLDAQLEQDNNEEVQEVFQRFVEYVETDPKGTLRACHPRHFPNCNAQSLCQQVLLHEPTKQLRTISREVGINEQTLYSHWDKKCKPLLQQILQQLGYSPGRSQ